MDPDDKHLLDTVGRRIAELRERADLTQAEAAERFGTTTSNWQRIEHGLQNLTLLTMAKISKILGVEVVDLLAQPDARRRGPGRPPNRTSR